jgi:hypothetical protein
MAKLYYKRSSDALFAEVAGDVVALHVQRGHSYGMEKVTASVWRLLEQPIDLETICGQLEREYEVDPETCRQEVGQLIELLEQEGLIEAVTQ